MGKMDEAAGVTVVLTPHKPSGELRITAAYDDYDEEELGVLGPVLEDATPWERRLAAQREGDAYMAGRGFGPVNEWIEVFPPGWARSFERKGARDGASQ